MPSNLSNASDLFFTVMSWEEGERLSELVAHPMPEDPKLFAEENHFRAKVAKRGVTAFLSMIRKNFIHGKKKKRK